MALTPSLPTLPLTYPELLGYDDVDPFATETTSDLQTLAQDVYHILLEWLGSNIDDPLRGIGIETYLSGTQDDLVNLPSLITTQLNQDDRIQAAQVDITQLDAETFRIQVQVQVAGQVLGLLYNYSNGAGLILTSSIGGF